MTAVKNLPSRAVMHLKQKWVSIMNVGPLGDGTCRHFQRTDKKTKSSAWNERRAAKQGDNVDQTEIAIFTRLDQRKRHHAS